MKAYKSEHLQVRMLPVKSGCWSTAHARIIGLGTVNMHVVSPWNRPFVDLLLIWLVSGYFPCALSYNRVV